MYSLHVTGKPNTLILYIETSAAKSAQVREKRRQIIIWSLIMKLSRASKPARRCMHNITVQSLLLVVPAEFLTSMLSCK
jgi:hypothetical protein